MRCRSVTTYVDGRSWIVSYGNKHRVSFVVFQIPQRVRLTRPIIRVIVSTKCEVKMTRKYRVASSAIVPKILGALKPGIFDFLAKKRINENASESDFGVVSGRLAPPGYYK